MTQQTRPQEGRPAVSATAGPHNAGSGPKPRTPENFAPTSPTRALTGAAGPGGHQSRVSRRPPPSAAPLASPPARRGPSQGCAPGAEGVPVRPPSPCHVRLQWWDCATYMLAATPPGAGTPWRPPPAALPSGVSLPFSSHARQVEASQAVLPSGPPCSLCCCSRGKAPTHPPPTGRPRDALSPAEPPGPAPASPWFLGLAGPPRAGVCRGSLSKSRVQATVTACQPSQHCQSPRELGNQSGGNIGNMRVQAEGQRAGCHARLPPMSALNLT